MAADFHLTPEGAGKKDGSNWANALPQSALEATFNERMQAGDRLRLGSGTYPQARLNLARGGDAGRPKVIAGIDIGTGLPVLSADWTTEKERSDWNREGRKENAKGAKQGRAAECGKLEES